MAMAVVWVVVRVVAEMAVVGRAVVRVVAARAVARVVAKAVVARAVVMVAAVRAAETVEAALVVARAGEARAVEMEVAATSALVGLQAVRTGALRSLSQSSSPQSVPARDH